ncbi:MAG: helix-turn-helix transcriptional regulator [Peptoniphilaceae bacterium]|nr:helix-turn-helix transcriptional regulator [Peptoniphilaceae bacterium]MDY6019143.1 helix-turn-helix transcriptional regulator [Anaerococcus sp.]
MRNKKLLFANFLKEIRVKNHLTQEELSEKTFINVKTISNMENAKVNFDFDNLEILSSVLKVDFIEKYFEVFYGDSNDIDSIINSLNSKDRINGYSQLKEIDDLTRIKNSTQRSIVKLKSEKLILFLKSIQEKDNIQKRRELIVEALNVDGYFDFNDLKSNYYEDIDYRILMNYALTLSNNKRLIIYKFIEESISPKNNLYPILCNNIANTYLISNNNEIALRYINMAIATSSSPSPVMFYTKGLILENLSLPYKKYIYMSLELAKNDKDTYNHILKLVNSRKQK